MAHPAIMFSISVSTVSIVYAYIQHIKKDKQQQDELHLSEVVTPSPVPLDNTGQNIDLFDDSENDTSDENKADKNNKPQLDIFV